jgi:hypothetical protein
LPQKACPTQRHDLVDDILSDESMAADPVIKKGNKQRASERLTVDIALFIAKAPSSNWFTVNIKDFGRNLKSI